MTDGTRPIMQRCTFCGQDWWDSHACTPPKDMLAKLTKLLPPAPPAPLPQGLRISANLTEADVRRIVREELAARFPIPSQERP